MNHRHALLLAAAASLLAVSTSAVAADKGAGDQEKCYGVAKAGHNDCASKTGSHSCAGQSKKDNDPNDFKMVAKGTCKTMGGMLDAPKKKM